MAAERVLTDDLELLLKVLPQRLRSGLEASQRREGLLEIVSTSVGAPEARYPGRRRGAVERAGRPRRPAARRRPRRPLRRRQPRRHRAHAAPHLRDAQPAAARSSGSPAAWGARSSAPSTSSATSSRAAARSCSSGRPGVGKTTMLREVARVLADELGKRVMVVDTSNEIAGDGDIPHPGIGRARRMQVPTPEAAARGDDRGGGEPHAGGDRHRRDRHRSRGAGGAHHRRARRAAHRHRARQHARQPAARTRRSPTSSAASRR